MVAACAALVSFSAITACSGGMEKSGADDVKGYLTYNGFTKQMHGVRIEAGAVYMNIKPYATLDDDYSYSNSELPITAGRRMYVELSNGSHVISRTAIATYTINSYQDETGIVIPPDQATAGTLPYNATLVLSLGEAASTTNTEILSSLFYGASHDNAAISEKIEFQLWFVDGNGGQTTYSTMVRYTGDSNTVYQSQVSGYGPFTVIR